MEPKGKLIIIGGAEDKTSKTPAEAVADHSILERIIVESKHGTNSVIEIVATAAQTPKEVGKEYVKVFQELKAKKVYVLPLEKREDTADKKIVERLAKADVVFFTGGDQLRLTTILGGSPFYDALVQRLREDKEFIYAGTSAGAAAVAECMIVNGTSENAILKGEVQASNGFGLLSDIVFDTHFITRGRIGRLFQIIVTNPRILGVGLEENTGLLIQNNKMEAIGPGMTIVVDGREILKNNLLEIRTGAPISIEGLKLHVMSRVDVFDLNNRTLEIITPEDLKC